ncbi:MAG: nuclear transport factor 2 family protein [Caldilineaceae bacterium]
MNQEQLAMQEVLQAEQAWTTAFLHLDLAVIEQLMADDYTIIQPGGAVWDKAKTLASLRSEQRHWDKAGSDELSVRIYGDTANGLMAVVIGRWTAKGVNHGQAFDYQARYMAVWVKQAGRWQIVADQSTEILSELP